MANSQPRHPQPMANRSGSLFGPFAVAPVDFLSSGAGCVHAGFDRTIAALSAPSPPPVADTVVGGGRQNSSSSEETEEGFVVVADEVGAPWDTNHTNQAAPTFVSSAIQSARHTWTSILPSRLKSTAAPLPSLNSPQQRQSSAQDVSAWEMEPPLEDATAFGALPGAKVPECAPSSGEVRSRLSQPQLTALNEVNVPGGFFSVAQEQRHDPLGESAAWQRQEGVAGSGNQEGKRAAVLEAWKAKVERRDRTERNIQNQNIALAGLKKRTSKMILQEGRHEKMGGAATGRTKEQAEARLRQQVWRREQKEVRTVKIEGRTGEMLLQDGWYERMGGARSGHTKEEAEMRVREQVWRRAAEEERAAALQRRNAAREAMDAEASGRGADLYFW